MKKLLLIPLVFAACINQNKSIDPLPINDAVFGGSYLQEVDDVVDFTVYIEVYGEDLIEAPLDFLDKFNLKSNVETDKFFILKSEYELDKVRSIIVKRDKSFSDLPKEVVFDNDVFEFIARVVLVPPKPGCPRWSFYCKLDGINCASRYNEEGEFEIRFAC